MNYFKINLSINQSKVKKKMKEKCVICKKIKNLGDFELDNSNNGSVCKDCYKKSNNKSKLHELYDAYYQK